MFWKDSTYSKQRTQFVFFIGKNTKKTLFVIRKNELIISMRMSLTTTKSVKKKKNVYQIEQYDVLIVSC